MIIDFIALLKRGFTMDNAILGYCMVIFGIIVIVLMILVQLRNRKSGVMYLDGKVIAIDPDTQAIHIRYKIDDNTYQDISCPKNSPYFSYRAPDIGLSVLVNVRRDDPYKVVSILMTTKLIPFIPIGYSNSSRFLTALRFALFGPLFVIVGIIFILSGS